MLYVMYFHLGRLNKPYINPASLQPAVIGIHIAWYIGCYTKLTYNMLHSIIYVIQHAI